MLTKSDGHLRIWSRWMMAFGGILFAGSLLFALSASILASPGQTVVTIATWDQTRAEQLKKDFIPYMAKKHPDIKLKIEAYANYDAKLLTVGGSDVAPDVFETNGARVFEYIMAGLAINLDPYVKRDLNMNDYFPNPWYEVRYPYRTGSLYAVPHTWVVSLLYYNPSLTPSCAETLV